MVAVMCAAGEGADATRLRGVIVVLWRAGLRISEALALDESDLDSNRGAILIRRGKGGLCRIRHRRPYVAPGTMLRSRLWWQARAGDRGLSAEHSLGWVRDSPGTREGCRAAGSGRAWRWSARCGQARVV
ncbi:MAG: tyrosine-type recombinase/integrase [Solirubrobacteraceae bacterium]